MSAPRILLVSGARAGADVIRTALPGARLRLAEANTAEVAEAIEDADAVVTAALSGSELRRARELRLVQTLGAGYEEIAVEALPPACVLCNVYLHEIAIAEWVLMAMLALPRRLIPHDRDLRRGVWHDAYRFEGTPVPDARGGTLGLVGVGTIGAEVARMARALDMDVIGVTRRPAAERRRQLGLRWLRGLDAIGELCAESRFVVLAVPLTGETRGLIRAADLDALGPDGYLLNVCRGPVVDEADLYHALKSGVIAGAALDVWYQYPASSGEIVLPAHEPFWELDNVLMTPHIAGFARSTFERRWNFIAQQLVDLSRPQALRNVVVVGA